jgi:hypothetical protein
MMAAEVDIVAILMQAQRATPAALAHHNMAQTTTLDPPLQIPADPVHPHLLIQARRPAPVRPLDQVPALPLPIPLRRTQATAHRPDQATVRQLHLRPRHLPRRRIPAEAVDRHNK